MAKGVIAMHSTCADDAASTTATTADIASPRPQSPRDPEQGNQRCHHQDGVDDRSVEDLAQQAPDGSIAGKIGRDPGHIPGNGQAERGLQRPRKRPPLRRNGCQEPAAGNDLRIERGHDLVMRDWGVARHVSCSERDDESRHDQHDEIERCPGCQALCPPAPGAGQAPGRQRQEQCANRNEHQHVLRLHQHARHAGRTA